MILEVASYLIWVSILLFLLGMVFEEHARRLSAVGWVTFGAYWFSRFPRYYGETHSFIKTFLVIAALPVSVYFAYHVLRGKDVLVRLSQTVAAMGLIYLPFATWEPLTNALIEHTAAQEHRVLSFFGVDARLVEMDGLQKRFVIDNPATGETYSTYIVLACTGIGSMSIFGGIIAAVNAPLKAKMKALAVTMPTIYVLNIARTAFITTAYGHQWFRIADDTISDFMNEPSGYASFFWADKVISQSLSVVVLVVLMLAVIRFMPGVMEMLEDLLELVGLGKETDDVSPEPDPDPETEAAT